MGSLFAGVGGFDIAADRAGFEVRWEVENDPFCCRVLAKHWPQVRRYGNIRTVSGADLEPVDVVTFGSPCQDFSIAGRRAGLEGERGGLFYEAVRILRELRPTVAVLENVPGLLSSKRGRDFAVVLRTLAELGPVDLAWRILDARWFGVPQRRRRLFVVADFRGQRAVQILFEPEGGRRHPAPRQATQANIACCPRDSATSARRDDGAGRVMRRPLLPELAYTLASGRGPGRLQHEQSYVPVLAPTPGLVRDAVPTLNHDGQAVAYQCHGSNVGPWGALRRGNGGLTGGVPFTVVNGNSRPVVVRRLTPTECERLQGLSSGHTCLCGITPYATASCRCPDSPRYGAVGNAVAVPVAEWLLRRCGAAVREEQLP